MVNQIIHPSVMLQIQENWQLQYIFIPIGELEYCTLLFGGS